ncbi:hypothetical protein EVAR_8703_1 [Eumeta japonica]|uniref:Uncharacterized protein n=1 Tax=Eumeta variegata TaxID=151549 RepID=A0A4C1TV03_EUMVA|nr:hypothetical protein EVAR_8703_1 [Eumeta japonica]
MSVVGGDHLLSRGPYARLSLKNPIKIIQTLKVFFVMGIIGPSFDGGISMRLGLGGPQKPDTGRELDVGASTAARPASC